MAVTDWGCRWRKVSPNAVIEVESEPGQGSVFRVSFEPRTRVPPAAGLS